MKFVCLKNHWSLKHPFSGFAIIVFPQAFTLKGWRSAFIIWFRGTTQPLQLDQPGSLGDLLTSVINHLLTGMILQVHLVGGFNSFEKYESNWKTSPNRGENKNHVKPPVMSIAPCWCRIWNHHPDNISYTSYEKPDNKKQNWTCEGPGITTFQQKGHVFAMSFVRIGVFVDMTCKEPQKPSYFPL